MKISMIAAVDRAHGIGRDNALPWKLPADMARFKSMTMGAPVIMGSKTAQSLGRALPGRGNIVLTRTGKAPFKGMHAVSSPMEALSAANGASEAWIIGGGEIYTLFLPLADRLVMTFVDHEIPGADAFFPQLHERDWMPVSHARYGKDDQHAHDFCFIEFERVQDPI